MPETSTTWNACAACLRVRPCFLTTPADYDEAAALFRRCRREGDTLRRLIDCLIASVAIRAAAPILHSDGDFDVLARHAGLRVDSVDS